MSLDEKVTRCVRGKVVQEVRLLADGITEISFVDGARLCITEKSVIMKGNKNEQVWQS